MCAAKWIVVGLLALPGWACVIDSIPLPDGEPDDEETYGNEPPANQAGSPDANLDTGAAEGNASTPVSPDAEADVLRGLDVTRFFHVADAARGTIRLVGAPAAMPGLGTVIVTNDDDATWAGTSTTSLDDGSFNLNARAVLGQRLRVVFTQRTAQYGPEQLLLAAPSVDAYAATLELNPTPHDAGTATRLEDLPEVTAAGVVVFGPVGEWVAVRGGTGSLSQGLAVVVANLDSGGGNVAPVSADGSFAVDLLGVSGDELHVFVVEPAVSRGGAAELLTQVP